MDKFVGDQLLALSKYSREQKGRRTYLLRCKKVGSVGKSGLGGDLQRWEVILGGDLGKIGVRGDSAGHWADGTTAFHFILFCVNVYLPLLRMFLQFSETLGDVTVLQRVQILGEHLGIIFSGWFGTILLRQLFEISFQILSQVLNCSTFLVRLKNIFYSSFQKLSSLFTILRAQINCSNI